MMGADAAITRKNAASCSAACVSAMAEAYASHAPECFHNDATGAGEAVNLRMLNQRGEKVAIGVPIGRSAASFQPSTTPGGSIEWSLNITSRHHAHRNRLTRQAQGTRRCLDIRSGSFRRLCQHQPGYVSTNKDGTERLKFTAFYEALLEAKGVTLGDGEGGGGKRRPGRSLSFNTKFQFNADLLVGKAYTAQLGLEPGDEFEIKLGRKQIKLIPLGATEEE
jgi:hypothetical protein